MSDGRAEAGDASVDGGQSEAPSPGRSDTDLASRLVRQEILEDALIVAGVSVALLVLRSALDNGGPLDWLIPVVSIAAMAGIIALLSRREGRSQKEARKLASPELTRGLLNLMHRSQTRLVRGRAMRLMVIALGGVHSKHDLHQHEWRTVVAVAGSRKKKVSICAAKVIGRLKVVEMLPDMRRALEHVHAEGWKYEAELTEALEKANAKLESTKSQAHASESTEIAACSGWPERKLIWFWKGFTLHAIVQIVRVSVAGFISLMLGGVVYQLSGRTEISVALSVIHFVFFMNRMTGWLDQGERQLFPTDNVPASVFLEALRTSHADKFWGRYHPLRRYLPHMAEGATDFSPLTADDWRFLLDRMEDLEDGIAGPIAEAIGRHGPVSLLAEVESRIPGWMASRAKSAPKMIERLTRVRLLLRSRMIPQGTTPEEGP